MTVKRLACLAGFVLVSGGCAADRLTAPREPSPQPSNILRVRGAGPDQPMFIIDGEIYGAGRPHPDVDPAAILSVQVIKGRDAVPFYGAAGAHGVVVVTTEEGARRAGGVAIVPADAFELRGPATVAPTSAEPLVLVDGVRVAAATLRDIDAERILDIQVLKGPDAVERYGEGAAEGVVLVRTKPASGGMRR